MTQSERDLLVEQVLSAHRERDGEGRLLSHPAWHDLPAADRVDAFEATVVLRRMEAALSEDGLSGSGRAVMERIRRG
jgi:hypothetical protein